MSIEDKTKELQEQVKQTDAAIQRQQQGLAQLLELRQRQIGVLTVLGELAKGDEEADKAA